MSTYNISYLILVITLCLNTCLTFLMFNYLLLFNNLFKHNVITKPPTPLLYQFVEAVSRK